MPTVWLKEWARPRHGASLPWRVKVPDTFRAGGLLLRGWTKTVLGVKEAEDAKTA